MFKPIVADLEQVDEKFRDAYVAQKGEDGKETGRFILAVEQTDGFELVDTSGFRATLDKLRNEVKTHKNELTKFEGIDPVQHKATLEELQQLKEADPNKEADIEKIVTQRTETVKNQMADQLTALKTEAAKREETIAGENTQLRSLLTKTMVTDKALAMATGISIAPDLLAPHIEPFLKLSIEGETATLEIVDENGVPRTGKDFQTPMTVQELIEEISTTERFLPLIKGTENSGSGSQPPAQKLGVLPSKFDQDGDLTARTQAIGQKLKKRAG